MHTYIHTPWLMCGSWRTIYSTIIYPTFHCGGFRDRTQIFRLGSRHLDPMSPLATQLIPVFS